MQRSAAHIHRVGDHSHVILEEVSRQSSDDAADQDNVMERRDVPPREAMLEELTRFMRERYGVIGRASCRERVSFLV